MKCFKGKVAIVTGGASGIGQGICEELAREGAQIIIADINIDKANATADSICTSEQNASAVQLDVTDYENFKTLIDDTFNEYGRLDYLFNNAGIALMGEVRDMTIDQYRRLNDVNVMGVVNGCHAAYPGMIKQGHGHIVNIGSITGVITFPVQAFYSATKHAVQGFSTGLREEAAHLGIKVSVICPMNIKSEIGNAITVVGVEDEDFFSNLPVSWMDTRKAVCKMLKGVAKNKGVIVVPSHAKIFWWLYRLNPKYFGFMGRMGVKAFRKYRNTG